LQINSILFFLSKVDAKNIRKLMSEKVNVAMAPGGFEEATLTTVRENRIFIK
jgi:hypothetical protein